MRPQGIIFGPMALKGAVSTSCPCLHQGVQSRRALFAVLLRKSGEAGNVRAHARRLDKERLRLEWFGGVLQVLGK